MLKERDLSMAWLARRIGRHEVWVGRKLHARTAMTLEDYAILRDAIEQIEPSGLTKK